jgi:hypothetical protein
MASQTLLVRRGNVHIGWCIAISGCRAPTRFGGEAGLRGRVQVQHRADRHATRRYGWREPVLRVVADVGRILVPGSGAARNGLGRIHPREEQMTQVSDTMATVRIREFRQDASKRLR